jgi:hypothetical protein
VPVRSLALASIAAWLLVGCGGGSSSSSPSEDAGSLDGTTGPDTGATDGAMASDGTSPTDATTDANGAGETGAPGTDAGNDAGACGYKGEGKPLHVSAGVDLCMPPVVCDPETCPPPLGSCVNGACVFGSGYDGVSTLPEAWATHYCALSTGGCHGVTQNSFPEDTAQAIATQTGTTVCDQTAKNGCVGIAASSPMVVGNSQLANDPATGKPVGNWGLGLTEASGLCYAITGPGGSAIVALTDRCGGYCKCGGSGYQECGPCVNATDMQPNCPCVGTAPSLYTECCGNGCPTLNAECDWCPSNNHPHFDLDDGTFDWVCGNQANEGSCQLTHASYVPCFTPTTWPPGGSGGSCMANAFDCSGTPAAHQDLVPGTSCCCNYDQCPQADGSCAAPPANCKAGSCTCGAGMPDANHPMVPSTGCCCEYGTSPQADGTCQ